MECFYLTVKFHIYHWLGRLDWALALKHSVIDKCTESLRY